MTYPYPSKIPNDDDPWAGPTNNFPEILNMSLGRYQIRCSIAAERSRYQPRYPIQYSVVYRDHVINITIDTDLSITGNIRKIDGYYYVIQDETIIESHDGNNYMCIKPKPNWYCVTEEDTIEWVKSALDAIDRSIPVYRGKSCNKSK